MLYVCTIFLWCFHCIQDTSSVSWNISNVFILFSINCNHFTVSHNNKKWFCCWWIGVVRIIESKQTINIICKNQLLNNQKFNFWSQIDGFVSPPIADILDTKSIFYWKKNLIFDSIFKSLGIFSLRASLNPVGVNKYKRL